MKEYLTLIENLNLNQIDDSDINLLLSNLVQNEKSKFSRDIKINSIKIFDNDSIYVSFSTEREAHSASIFFDNFTFKTFTLRSFYINPNKINLNSNEILLNNSKNQKIQFKKVECEILVAYRGLLK